MRSCLYNRLPLRGCVGSCSRRNPLTDISLAHCTRRGFSLGHPTEGPLAPRRGLSCKSAENRHFTRLLLSLPGCVSLFFGTWDAGSASVTEAWNPARPPWSARRMALTAASSGGLLWTSFSCAQHVPCSPRPQHHNPSLSSTVVITCWVRLHPPQPRLPFDGITAIVGTSRGSLKAAT